MCLSAATKKCANIAQNMEVAAKDMQGDAFAEYLSDIEAAMAQTLLQMQIWTAVSTDEQASA